MRIVMVEDRTPTDVAGIYAKRLSVVEAVLLDMDREQREAGQKPKPTRTAADVIAYCKRKSAPLVTTPTEAGEENAR